MLKYAVKQAKLQKINKLVHKHNLKKRIKNKFKKKKKNKNIVIHSNKNVVKEMNKIDRKISLINVFRFQMMKMKVKRL